MTLCRGFSVYDMDQAPEPAHILCLPEQHERPDCGLCVQHCDIFHDAGVSSVPVQCVRWSSRAWVCTNVTYFLSVFLYVPVRWLIRRTPGGRSSRRSARERPSESQDLLFAVRVRHYAHARSALRSYPRPLHPGTAVPAWALLDVAVSLRHTPSLGLPCTTDASRFISNRALLT